MEDHNDGFSPVSGVIAKSEACIEEVGEGGGDDRPGPFDDLPAEAGCTQGGFVGCLLEHVLDLRLCYIHHRRSLT